ncbi:NEDD4-binding protein 2-like 1 isoform X2 [Tachyglossus aculeatus]|uniref:NEDD4-binding protein 2-like 1 isoform X2 n=1 Tax=Tachyglossus aculeatus TaxID=9261 RepID=UPI0018F42E1D|nr:NEDD4-binding protein 2-like 1 isoform X2 [Tachyglossus aculeatus]
MEAVFPATRIQWEGHVKRMDDSRIPNNLLWQLKRDFPQALIFSTDDFFVREDGTYEFNPDFLGEAHKWNQERARTAMRNGESPVIIDNTNLQSWEMRPYAVMEKHSRGLKRKNQADERMVRARRHLPGRAPLREAERGGQTLGPARPNLPWPGETLELLPRRIPWPESAAPSTGGFPPPIPELLVTRFIQPINAFLSRPVELLYSSPFPFSAPIPGCFLNRSIFGCESSLSPPSSPGVDECRGPPEGRTVKGKRLRGVGLGKLVFGG